MNDSCSDKSAVFLEEKAGIPKLSGCLLKRLLLCFCADRMVKGYYILPVCIALITSLWLGCPTRLHAADKLIFLDYETALQKSKDGQRPLLIFFTSPWCYQCTEMERKVFKDQEIITLLNNRFLLVEVDISEEKKLKEDFLISYTPTSLFLNTDGQSIIDIKGYIPTSRFGKLLRYVSEGHYKTTPFPDFDKE